MRKEESHKENVRENKVYRDKSQRGKVCTWIRALLLALMPIVCVLFRCALDGKFITDIYLPMSEWNDELFYYKLTEGVLNNGVPQGYFGFNESHGRYLSFAAWSPILLSGWVIYGAIFGWKLLSPILANILMMTLAMFAFGMLAKPSKAQTGMICCLYACFVPATRFILSCIPEAELFALFIVFWGLVLNCRKTYKGCKIGLLFALTMVMTWMRPYLILLLLTPIWLWLQYSRKQKKQMVKIAVISTCVFGVTMGIYGLINYLFSAPYLTELFYTEWIGKYFEEGLVGGLKYTIWKLITSFKSVLNIIWENLITPETATSAAGLYYGIFLLLVFVLAWKLVQDIFFRKRSWMDKLIELQMFLCMIGFFVADLLMYRLHEGGRHTLVYLVGMIVLMPYLSNSVMEETPLKEAKVSSVKTDKTSAWLTAIVAVCFLFLFVGRGNVPYEFAIPYGTMEDRQELEKLENQLAENMELSEDGIGYDNTVIWTLWDSVAFAETEAGVTDAEDEYVVQAVDFGAYYALPAGFGINLCDGGYMDVNLELLQSRYIGTAPGGSFEKRCIDAGGVLIGECDRLVVYDMRP